MRTRDLFQNYLMIGRAFIISFFADFSRRWLDFILLPGAAVALALFILAPHGAAAQADEAALLDSRWLKLARAGKYAEALPLAQKALTAWETALHSDDIKLAISLEDVARLHFGPGRAPMLLHVAPSNPVGERTSSDGVNGAFGKLDWHTRAEKRCRFVLRVATVSPP